MTVQRIPPLGSVIALLSAPERQYRGWCVGRPSYESDCSDVDGISTNIYPPGHKRLQATLLRSRCRIPVSLKGLCASYECLGPPQASSASVGLTAHTDMAHARPKELFSPLDWASYFVTFRAHKRSNISPPRLLHTCCRRSASPAVTQRSHSNQPAMPFGGRGRGTAISSLALMGMGRNRRTRLL